MSDVSALCVSNFHLLSWGKKERKIESQIFHLSERAYTSPKVLLLVNWKTAQNFGDWNHVLSGSTSRVPMRISSLQMNLTQARPSRIGIQSSSIPFCGHLFHSLSEAFWCVASVLSAKSLSTFCTTGQYHKCYLCFYLDLPFWDSLFCPSFIWAGFSGHWAQFLFNFSLKICTRAQMFFPKK